ncbi:MAG: glycoside hydrolase family 1 protein [Candidatus Sericytochromatia bacterium]|nr:glycoside hydrolase family 1 protein [Candidatus Tanganyikabacteria bacterium]
MSPRSLIVLLAALLAAACGQAPSGSGGGGWSLPPWPGQAPPDRPEVVTAFPRGFMWGVATAGHQTEGYDQTSQWAKWAAAGRTAQLPGRATDSWHRYREDYDLAKGMGLNSFRFSIEWAKVEPQRDRIDQAVVDHYVRVVDAARERGLEPIVTLHHFTYPAWLDTYKQPTGGYPGWEDVYTAQEFADYSRLMARVLRGKVKYYVTLNEPNIQAMLGYLAGITVPGKRSRAAFGSVLENFSRGHALAYDAIHEEDPQALVSTNLFRMLNATNPSAEFPVDPAEGFMDGLFGWRDGASAPLIKVGPDAEPPKGLRKLDYVSFDYYFAYRWMEALRIATQWDWPVVPEGIYTSLRYYHDRYHLPILIAENGMATEDGKPRPDGWSRESFLVNHVFQVRKAVLEGVKVLGYVHWSLLDNYEWGSFKPRFGLYRVDYAKPDLPRIPTPAVGVFKRIAEANDLPADLEKRYVGKKN